MDSVNNDIISQLERLSKLHAKGSLTEEEFSLAKKKLLSPENDVTPTPVKQTLPGSDKFNLPPEASNSIHREFKNFTQSDDIGRAANRYVSMQMVMAVIIIIIFCIFAMSFCSKQKEFEERFQSFPRFPSK